MTPTTSDHDHQANGRRELEPGVIDPVGPVDQPAVVVYGVVQVPRRQAGHVPVAVAMRRGKPVLATEPRP
jgi:hypothetical protein